VVYMALAWILRMPELSELKEIMRSRRK